MSVLAREYDSYQRAVQAYQREQAKHNQAVNQYNDTLVKDADGNLLVVDAGGKRVLKVTAEGMVKPGQLPAGKLSDYGMTPMPEEHRFQLLRQGTPVGTRREQIGGVRQDPETGQFYLENPSSGDLPNARDPLGPEWQVEKVENGEAGPVYAMARDVPAYMERPPEWTQEFGLKAPDPTFAGAKRAGMPSLAQIESGLIGQVLRGRGAR